MDKSPKEYLRSCVKTFLSSHGVGSAFPCDVCESPGECLEIIITEQNNGIQVSTIINGVCENCQKKNTQTNIREKGYTERDQERQKFYNGIMDALKKETPLDKVIEEQKQEHKFPIVYPEDRRDECVFSPGILSHCSGRPDKTHYYLLIAQAVAMRGTCRRRNFGSIIVKNDEIVSTGFTGAPRGWENCCDRPGCLREEQNVPRGERYELCRSVHSEMNAIISAPRSEMIGSTLYLVGIDVGTKTLVLGAGPCSICKRMIINAGISKVIVGNPVIINGYIEFDVQDWIKNETSAMDYTAPPKKEEPSKESEEFIKEAQRKSAIALKVPEEFIFPPDPDAAVSTFVGIDQKRIALIKLNHWNDNRDTFVRHFEIEFLKRHPHDVSITIENAQRILEIIRMQNLQYQTFDVACEPFGDKSRVSIKPKTEYLEWVKDPTIRYTFDARPSEVCANLWICHKVELPKEV
jgi:dCMP deaminase